MKLKMIAAAALAALALPSMAAIQTTSDAELVLVVFDATTNGGVASYAKDLGITLNDFVSLSSSAAGYSFSFDLDSAASAQWAAYKAADTNLLDGNTKWAILSTAISMPADPTPGGLRLLSTYGGAPVLSNFANGDWASAMQAVALKFTEINASGNHTTFDYAFNGDSSNAKGSAGYLPPLDKLDTLDFSTGNAVGTTSNLWLTQRSNDFDETTPIDGFAQGNSAGRGIASFDGSTFAYSVGAVAAVPEPGSVALLLAGLSALGFVGSRRRRND